MKLALLFAGQGSQYVGMGRELYDNFQEARDIYDKAKLDFELKDVCFNGPEELLNDTAYSQSCILTTSLAIANVLKAKGIHPDYVAGLSLGEYSALTYANAFQIEDAIEIVRKRGKIMASALPKGTSGMIAVMNTDATLIQDTIQDIENVTIANYNCPTQIVITGTNEGLEKASGLLKEAGAKRLIPLKVSGAFHSPLLSEAAKELEEVLKQYPIAKPTIPVVYNITGKEEQMDLIDILTKQIQSSVYFYPSIEYMIEKGVDTFIEIGPGKTLSGFVKKTNKEVKVMNVEDMKSLMKVLEELGYE